MQPGEILASRLPIMFMKGIQIKAQRIPTEDVHRRLVLIKTYSALKFKYDKSRVPHQQMQGALAQEAAGKLSWRWEGCSDIQPYVTTHAFPLLKSVSGTCRKGQAGLQEKLERQRSRRIR